MEDFCAPEGRAGQHGQLPEPLLCSQCRLNECNSRTILSRAPWETRELKWPTCLWCVRNVACTQRWLSTGQPSAPVRPNVSTAGTRQIARCSSRSSTGFWSAGQPNSQSLKLRRSPLIPPHRQGAGDHLVRSGRAPPHPSAGSAPVPLLFRALGGSSRPTSFCQCGALLGL